MADVFAQVTLLTAGADSADNQVNGFAATATGTGATDLDNWTLEIKAFYDAIKSLGGLRGIKQTGHMVKFYSIGAPAPNYPIYENTFGTTAAAAAVDLPLEVSLAVSYRNNTNNTVARARRRGRIFVSGFSSSANNTGRPIATVYEGVCDAYADYALALNALGPFEAGVWSRTDGIVYLIDEVWCDNEWDTQRRRGGKATTRKAVNI